MGSPVMFVGGSGMWLLLNAGANAEVIQELLGQSDSVRLRPQSDGGPAPKESLLIAEADIRRIRHFWPRCHGDRRGAATPI
jgi:hypothetical protein